MKLTGRSGSSIRVRRDLITYVFDAGTHREVHLNDLDKTVLYVTNTMAEFQWL